MNINAPEELKVAFDNKTLKLADLINHPEWVEWLNGEDDYVKNNCDGIDFYDWLNTERAEIPETVENYMVLLFESRIREEIIQDDYLIQSGIDIEHIFMGLFRERNSELFFDDLPYSNIIATIEDRQLEMEDIFNLSDEDKEILKDKNLVRGFYDFRYNQICRVFGGKIENFELYEKYRGIIEILADSISNEEPVNTESEKIELIEKLFVKNIDRTKRRYSADVPKEFKKKHSEYFLDDNAPKELKDIFYNSGSNIIGCETLDFKILNKHSEYIPFLKDKDIRHCMGGWINEYDDFFDFCANQNLAMELGLKYGDYVSKLNLRGRDEEDKEAVISEGIYTAIIYKCYQYNEDMPEYFKNRYPELFLDEDAPDELKNRYYKNSSKRTAYSLEYEDKELTFDYLKKNPEYVDFLKGKELRPIINDRYKLLLDLCDGDVDKFLAIGLEYGDIGIHQQLRSSLETLKKNKKTHDKTVEELKEIFDDLIGRAICEGKLLVYNDSLPLRLQYKYQSVFLLPEELELIKRGINKYSFEDELDMIKSKFYQKCISFRDLYLNDELKAIIRYKNIDRCMYFYKAGDFFRAFSEVLGGDFDKAYNLAIDKYSRQLNSILYGYIAENNIDRLVKFYKQTQFIPHPVVFEKLPDDKLKGFALNKKLWGELMKIEEYNSNDEYIGSLLELAIVMGVFETKEFKKNGKTMIQGAGEEGFEKIQELINYVPEYFEDSEISKMKYVFAMRGYSKFDDDYKDAIRDNKVHMICLKEGLIDDLKENTLTDYDMEILSNSYMPEEIKEFFRKDSNGNYHYILDSNSNTKVQKLLKTVGIKQDRWLSQEEFDLIKSCNREFISKAFIQVDEGYRFNISKQGEYYVIGNETEITEAQSKSNKKLFDYVRFLMQEYSMEEEASRLAANNDRSNIDLVLDSDKMTNLLNAADWVSKRTVDKYSECDLYKLNPEWSKYYKFLSANKLHQLFDGLNLEYSKEFRDFILQNKDSLIGDYELTNFMKAFQDKIKDLSQDPDYSNIKLTPEVLVKALNPNKNQYSSKKAGFEKGEELASKFSFSQEYFDHAQKVWDEARKREVSSIPRVEGIDEHYSYEVLRLDDAEGIFIGNLTDCCQRLGGAGESSMLHSMLEKNGRVFVVRDKDKRIIAQAWLWRNGNTICFDNVEIPDRARSNENEELVYKIIKDVAEELCDKDREELNRLVEEGRLSKEKAEALCAKKVTVGTGHNDIGDIVYNDDIELNDVELKEPIEMDKEYKGICTRDRLYIDSNHQVILYQAKDYISSDNMMAIHVDKNEDIGYDEMKYRKLKTIRSIIKEVEGECNFENREELIKQYDVTEDEIRLIQGTDWFMLYSEKDEDITIHKMLKSPSSGIMKKSVKEQREAVQMLMNKGKTVSMEFENDRVHKAARSMVRHMQKRYSMRVVDEGNRISVSEIQTR